MSKGQTKLKKPGRGWVRILCCHCARWTGGWFNPAHISVYQFRAVCETCSPRLIL